jgi:hypothetical protein
VLNGNGSNTTNQDNNNNNNHELRAAALIKTQTPPTQTTVAATAVQIPLQEQQNQQQQGHLPLTYQQHGVKIEQDLKGFAKLSIHIYSAYRISHRASSKGALGYKRKITTKNASRC